MIEKHLTPNKMTKAEILERVINLASSSFVDENYYDENNDDIDTDRLYDDMFEYVVEEFEEYDIEYTEEEITQYLLNNLTF
jgi:hypothetical protein